MTNKEKALYTYIRIQKQKEKKQREKEKIINDVKYMRLEDCMKRSFKCAKRKRFSAVGQR